MPGLAIVTHDDMIANKKDLVRRMVAASVEAMKIVQENPEAAIASLLKVKSTLDPKVHLEILKSSFDLFSSAASKGKPLGWIPPADIENAQNLLVEYDQIKTRAPISDYFTNEFVR